MRAFLFSARCVKLRHVTSAASLDDWHDRFREAYERYAETHGWNGEGDVQAWFARKISVAPATVNRWANNKAKPGLKARRKLAAIPEFRPLVAELGRPKRRQSEARLEELADRFLGAVARLEAAIERLRLAQGE